MLIHKSFTDEDNEEQTACVDYYDEEEGMCGVNMISFYGEEEVIGNVESMEPDLEFTPKHFKSQ